MNNKYKKLIMIKNFHFLNILKNKNKKQLNKKKFVTNKNIIKWNTFLVKKYKFYYNFLPLLFYSFNSIKLPYNRTLNIFIKKYLKWNYSNKFWEFFDIKKLSIKNFQKLHNFLILYYNIINVSFLYNYFVLNFYKNLINKKLIHYLTFSFKHKRFFINLTNFKRNNYIFLSSGFFLKFFKKKKSFKKNKIIKFLMIKSLRKFLILTQVFNLFLIIRSTSVNLLDLIRLLNMPLLRPFKDPIIKNTEKIYQETENNKYNFSYIYIMFLESQSFIKNKIKKKGRVKRKILRKLILKNNIID